MGWSSEQVEEGDGERGPGSTMRKEIHGAQGGLKITGGPDGPAPRLSVL